MRNACGILAALAVAMPAAAWAQERAAVRVQPTVSRTPPPVLQRQAPKAGPSLPQRQSHELSHTIQQGLPPMPARPVPAGPMLTPLDRPQPAQSQAESRAHTSIGNVQRSRQDGEQGTIGNAK